MLAGGEGGDGSCVLVGVIGDCYVSVGFVIRIVGYSDAVDGFDGF